MGEGVRMYPIRHIFFILLLSPTISSSYFLCNPEVRLFILTIKTPILHISWLLAILMPSPTYLQGSRYTVFPFSPMGLNQCSCSVIQTWDQITSLLLPYSPVCHSRNKIQPVSFISTPQLML